MYEYMPVKKRGMGSLGAVACEGVWRDQNLCNLTRTLSARAHSLRTAITDERFGFWQSQLAAALVEGNTRKDAGRGNIPASEWDQFTATLDAARHTFNTQTTTPSGIELRPTEIQITGAANIRTLQQEIIATAGCALPRYGADGKWGDETRTGTQCLINAKGEAYVNSKYPFVAELMGRPVTRPRVEPAAPPPEILPFPEPSIFDQWWFWGIVGVAAVGGTVAAYFYFAGEEEEVKLSPAARRIAKEKFPGLAAR